MFEWIVTMFACFIIGGAAILADRRWGERVLRTMKSLGKEHELTENLGHGFIAGKTPVTRLIAAFAISMFLWYINILNWVDVVPGFVVVALGMFLEPVFEWAVNVLLPFGSAINQTVSSLEKGDMAPLSKASSGAWGRIRKTWSASAAPKASTASPKIDDPSPDGTTPQDASVSPPVQATEPGESQSDLARRKYREYLGEG